MTICNSMSKDCCKLHRCPQGKIGSVSLSKMLPDSVHLRIKFVIDSQNIYKSMIRMSSKLQLG